ncbi:MAG TPA: hypothetical protein VFG10_00335 [Saprospiraceae bacterium]|nr:hypothetical protein [Saprospiraceae bacterium]
MKKIFLVFISMVLTCITHAQKVGVGTGTPAAKLEVRGVFANPTIPGIGSTGILRIGVAANEGIDIGKAISTPFAGWIQAGYNGTEGDPLSLQPSGGSVGIGTINPSISAALEIKSTSQGFLPPRMTHAARGSIIGPEAGLLIWCSDCGVAGEIQVHNGTTWTNMIGGPTALGIGENYGGGKVAYILKPGDPGYIAGEIHGLIAAPTDQSTGSSWGCPGINIQGANGIALGTGNQNTIDIINTCPESGIAARKCSDLILGGFSDWYLPSRDELNKLSLNRVPIGGFADALYWSSSEFTNNDAFDQFIFSGFQCDGYKGDTDRVRAVRSF